MGRVGVYERTTDRQTDSRADKLIDGWMDVGVDGWRDGGVDLLDRWMDGSLLCQTLHALKAVGHDLADLVAVEVEL